jgi:hypothetical protein
VLPAIREPYDGGSEEGAFYDYQRLSRARRPGFFEDLTILAAPPTRRTADVVPVSR